MIDSFLTLRNKLVFQEANDILSRHSTTFEQEKLLKRFLLSLEKQIQDDYMPFVNIPMLIHAAISGEENSAIKVAVASLFLFLAADIVDDIMDGDFTEHWGSDISSSEGLLASVVFASSIAPLCIDEIDAPFEITCAMKKTLSKSIIVMAAGQQADLSCSGSIRSTSAEQVIKNIQEKSGAEVAGFTLMAAQLARADKYVASEYESIGRTLGIACQIVSDCHELYSVDEGRDLVNGTVTLPLAIYSQSVSQDQKDRFSNLLKLAKHDQSARIKVRELVSKSGALSKTILFLRDYKIEALNRLDRLAPLEPAASELRNIIKGQCAAT